MKIYEAKTIEEAVDAAAKELNVTKEEVHYVIKEEKFGDFDKKAIIEVYSLEDVYQYGADYLKNAIKSIGIDVETECAINDEGLIRITINSERNPILIGRNGKTLRALNDLVKLVISNRFKRRYRVLLDVGDYKDKKYAKIISIARRVAKEVQRRHLDIKLDEMTPDERRMIHQVLQNTRDIKTESDGGEGNRAIVIKYIGVEEHAYQQSPVNYREVLSNRHGGKGGFRNNNNNRRFNKGKNKGSSLNDLLHKDANVFSNDYQEDKPLSEVREEDKMNEADKSIDDLPSASISAPLFNKEALSDLNEESKDNNNDNGDGDATNN